MKTTLRQGRRPVQSEVLDRAVSLVCAEAAAEYAGLVNGRAGGCWSVDPSGLPSDWLDLPWPENDEWEPGLLGPIVALVVLLIGWAAILLGLLLLGV